MPWFSEDPDRGGTVCNATWDDGCLDQQKEPTRLSQQDGLRDVPQKHTDETIPEGVLVIPSKLKPGEFSYFVEATGKKYKTLQQARKVARRNKKRAAESLNELGEFVLSLDAKPISPLVQ